MNVMNLVFYEHFYAKPSFLVVASGRPRESDRAGAAVFSCFPKHRPVADVDLYKVYIQTSKFEL